MAKIRVTKKFHFEMAHTLHNYDGLCKHIHGHSYHLEVTLIGEAKNEPGAVKDGMVMDFGDLKKIVKSKVVDWFDHSYMVNAHAPRERLEKLDKLTQRLIVVDFQPTAENIVVYIAELIKPDLPANIELYSIRLSETATAYAEWFADDNK